MRFILLFVCCITSLSVSAQLINAGSSKKQHSVTVTKFEDNPAKALWWQVGPLKKYRRFPMISQVRDNSIKHLPSSKLSPAKIYAVNFTTTGDYYLELAEAAVMKTAQHNMRFRQYAVASYNFSALAELYIKQNRFSEAKWYLLQSNFISRQQNDDKHTIANLMDLAMVKANLGDLTLAQQDLTEARQLANARGWGANASEIEKESQFIIHNRTTTPKLELRYADAVLADKKAVADKKTD